MLIEHTEFGSITIDGRTYDHDVVIELSGKVRKRHKKLSKEKYGTSHIVSRAEAEDVFEKGCHQLIIGSGQAGNVRLSPEASDYFKQNGCAVILAPTGDAIHSFNHSHEEKKIALMHVTC